MAKIILYWATTVLTALLFTLPGLGLLARASHFTDDMTHLGYPLYFLTFLGVWKVLGAIAILIPGLPRVKEWAYAGMMFDLSGAIVSRAALSDGIVKVIVPVAIGCLVASSWALRPNGRVLQKQE